MFFSIGRYKVTKYTKKKNLFDDYRGRCLQWLYCPDIGHDPRQRDDHRDQCLQGLYSPDIGHHLCSVIDKL